MFLYALLIFLILLLLEMCNIVFCDKYIPSSKFNDGLTNITNVIFLYVE